MPTGAKGPSCFGGLIASAQRAEVKLAEPALATVKVPRPRGGHGLGPRHWWQTRITTVGLCAAGCRDETSSPAFPTEGTSAPRPGRKTDLVVRYEWLAHVYLAFVLLAFILICLDRILK